MKKYSKFFPLLILTILAAALSAPAMAQGDPAGSTPGNPPTNEQANPPAQQEKSRPRTITIPAGTPILIRMISSIDSTKNRIGDYFHASLESALVVEDTVLAPRGADVYGKLTNAKAAGKISGGAELTLELTGVRIGENVVPIVSTNYDVVAKGRGKQSAGRIGGGAALGAIIGGIAGGGTGAAIGAGVGAAAGTTVQLATHGEKIKIPSETLLEFKTEQPVDAPIPPASR